MTQSTRRLREICQHTRDDKFYQGDWLDRNLLRRVSIYPTRFFLKAGLSPNKVTLLSLLAGIAAGALFAFPQAEYWLLGWSLLFLSQVLDCCDGEIARFRGSASSIGEYNDVMAGGYFLFPFLYACMSFGIYQALGSSIIFILGFALVVGWIVFSFSPILYQAILCRKGALEEALDQTEKVEYPQTLSRGIIPYGRMLFSPTGFFFSLLIISVSDTFISPFSIGSLDFNVRFIYVALFALAAVLGSLLRVYDVNKHGVRLHK